MVLGMEDSYPVGITEHPISAQEGAHMKIITRLMAGVLWAVLKFSR